MLMKHLCRVLVLVQLGFFAYATLPAVRAQDRVLSNDAEISRAFDNQESNVQAKGKGIVARLLQDDNDGSRHQRFILKLKSGQTLLIAHNIDLAPRVTNLKIGDTVEFLGEYEWNPKGGAIHWTHRDPDGHHKLGWLKHKGRTYR